MGISAGVSTGLIHVLFGDSKKIGDYMPCDFAINGIIVATWYRGSINSKECVVLNSACGKKKTINPSDVIKTREFAFPECPPTKMLWYPSVTVTKSKFIFHFFVLFTHILPALIIDCVLKFNKINFR
jgi:alcohol-forming fatty acyl-CoA reductase